MFLKNKMQNFAKTPLQNEMVLRTEISPKYHLCCSTLTKTSTKKTCPDGDTAAEVFGAPLTEDVENCLFIYFGFTIFNLSLNFLTDKPEPYSQSGTNKPAATVCPWAETTRTLVFGVREREKVLRNLVCADA